MSENEEIKLDPVIEEFLDARTFSEKYDILVKYQQDITNRNVDDMAAAIDEIIAEGEIHKRVVDLKSIVYTKAKYENTRLRGGKR